MSLFPWDSAISKSFLHEICGICKKKLKQRSLIFLGLEFQVVCGITDIGCIYDSYPENNKICIPREIGRVYIVGFGRKLKKSYFEGL